MQTLKHYNSPLTRASLMVHGPNRVYDISILISLRAQWVWQASWSITSLLSAARFWICGAIKVHTKADSLKFLLQKTPVATTVSTSPWSADLVFTDTYLWVNWDKKFHSCNLLQVLGKLVSFVVTIQSSGIALPIPRITIKNKFVMIIAVRYVEKHISKT